MKRKRNILDNTVVTVDTIWHCIAQKFPIIDGLGIMYHRACIEMAVVTIIVQMAQINKSLTPLGRLKLMNDMTSGTDAQVKLIKWKDEHKSNSIGTVGKKY